MASAQSQASLLSLVADLLTLVANSYVAFRAAKGEQRVCARGMRNFQGNLNRTYQLL
jgi:hypothetical protein